MAVPAPVPSVATTTGSTSSTPGRVSVTSRPPRGWPVTPLPTIEVCTPTVRSSPVTVVAGRLSATAAWLSTVKETVGWATSERLLQPRLRKPDFSAERVQERAT